MQRGQTLSHFKTLNKGFTIVELLIVVVVIAILATITIVGFNGIQNRTQNTKTESTVAQYRKMLIAYASEKRSYPDESSACLGEMSDYPDGCFSGAPNATFNTNLKSWLNTSTHPAPNTECLSMYGGCRRAAAFSRLGWSLDGSTPNHSYWLIYVLKGSAKCTVPGLSGGTWNNPTSTPTANGWTESHTGTSLCRVILPDPTTL